MMRRLGMMIAGQLYYPFYGDVETDDTKLAARVSEVARELGQRGKPTAGAAPPSPPKDSSAVTVASPARENVNQSGPAVVPKMTPSSESGSTMQPNMN